MRSVPGAGRGPRAGSPRGVEDATGSSVGRSHLVPMDPVATAPGTDSNSTDSETRHAKNHIRKSAIPCRGNHGQQI